MEPIKSKVYALPNEAGYITRIDGGYTISNIADPEAWVLIDEGTGDRYNLCQSNYFDRPLMTDEGAYNYKLVDGQPVACTAEEIAAQIAALPKPTPVPTNQENADAITSLQLALAEVYELMIGGGSDG